MLFKKEELKLLWPFYVYYFFMGTWAMVSLYLVLYFRQLSFSFFEISILFSSFGFSMFLFEIPTGIIADKYSRKMSVLIGFFLAVILIFLLGFVTSFLLFLVLFILLGIAMTFISGAEEAWIIDNLKLSKRKDLYNEYYIKSTSISAISAAISMFLSSFVLKFYSMSYLFFITAVCLFIGGLILFIFSKEYYVPKKKSKVSFIKTIGDAKKGLKYLKNHAILFYLILGVLFISVIDILFDYWQPFLISVGMPIYYIGSFFSIIAIIKIFSPFIVKKFSKNNEKKIIICMVLFVVILLSLIFALSYVGFIIVAILIGLFAIIKTAKYIVISSYFQKQVPTKARATLTSTKNMFSQAFLAFFALLLGYLADIIGIRYVILSVIPFGLLGILFFLRIKDKSVKVHR
ncbi:MAG: MFS transporter [Candidatus Woesearchaeota archaeon]|jgi:MFS family permease